MSTEAQALARELARVDLEEYLAARREVLAEIYAAALPEEPETAEQLCSAECMSFQAGILSDA